MYKTFSLLQLISKTNKPLEGVINLHQANSIYILSIQMDPFHHSD